MGAFESKTAVLPDYLGKDYSATRTGIKEALEALKSRGLTLRYERMNIFPRGIAYPVLDEAGREKGILYVGGARHGNHLLINENYIVAA